MRTYEEMMENRLAKLRLGQAAGEIVTLLDGETRLCLVPLIDAEYVKALTIADRLDAGNNAAGMLLRDQVQREAILSFSAREVNDWQETFFKDMTEVAKLGAHEVNYLFDIYLEMTAVNSPSLNMLSDEDFEALKKVWTLIQWSELTGQQWYAAKRFLDSIQPNLLAASLSGSNSTSGLTPMTQMSAPVASASPNETT